MFHQTIRQDIFKGGSSSCCGGPNGSRPVNWSCAEMKCFQTEDKDCKVNMWLVSLELVLDPFLTQTSSCSQVIQSTWIHEAVFKLILFYNTSKCYTRRKVRIHWNSVWDWWVRFTSTVDNSFSPMEEQQSSKKNVVTLVSFQPVTVPELPEVLLLHQYCSPDKKREIYTVTVLVNEENQFSSSSDK